MSQGLHWFRPQVVPKFLTADMSKKTHATKKVLLSLAVIAASGGYVAIENASPQANRGIGQAGSARGLVVKTAAPSLTLGLDARAAESPKSAVLFTSSPSIATQPEPAQSPDPAAAATAGPAPDDRLAVAASPQPDIRADIRADMTGPSNGDAPIAPGPAAPSADLPRQTAPADAGQTRQQGNVTQSVVTLVLPEFAPLPDPRPADAPSVTGSVRVAQAGPRDGTFKGPSENAYYGRVQLAAVIKSGQIQRIRVLDHPNDYRRSRYINRIALPMLEQEAVRAQSANIDIVSGATLTSVAFIRSLSAALSAARG